MATVNIVGTNNLNVTPESEQIYVGNNPLAQMEGTEIPSTDSYDNISIPNELFSEQSEGSNTEQAVTTESIEPAKTEATNEPDQEVSDTVQEQTDTVSESTDEQSFVYETEDGSRYSSTDIESWKKDADNRHEWNKSNTEKAQTVADQRRAVEPLVQLVEKIKQSEDFSETLIEAIEDELGKEAGQLFKQSLQMDNKDLPNPYESELTEARDKVAQMEAQNALDQTMAELKTTYSLDDKQSQEVLDYAIQKHEKDGRLLTLEEAYKVMNFDKPKAEAVQAKPKPSVPVNVQKNVGVKSDKQSKITSYDGIDVASFFNT
tara:strand:+ start:396 stop:1349 length:954 start_codon:yes stop_codon:yes gene_type:complete